MTKVQYRKNVLFNSGMNGCVKLYLDFKNTDLFHKYYKRAKHILLYIKQI